MDVINLMFDFFNKIMDMKDLLYEFLFTVIDIPVIGSFSVWQLLSGGALIVLLTFVIIKAVNFLG